MPEAAQPEGWCVANDTPCWLKPPRTIYFLVRYINSQWEHYRDRRGRLRTWRTRAGAERKRLALLSKEK